MSKQVFIEAPGILGPGIGNWQEFLSNGLQAVGDELPKLVADRLPRNERRRATQLTRLAFMSGEQTANTTSVAVENLANIFVSSCSSTDIVDSVCMQLGDEPLLVSPTQFHNSVHNAPVGYWSIATAAKLASSSICAHDHSFAAGLLEAYSQVVIDEHPVMLIAADIAVTGRLKPFRDVPTPFACSLVLTSERTNASIAALSLSVENDGHASQLVAEQGNLETLRLGNPAARALPLLTALAKPIHSDTGNIIFDMNGCYLKACVEALSEQ